MTTTLLWCQPKIEQPVVLMRNVQTTIVFETDSLQPTIATINNKEINFTTDRDGKCRLSFIPESQNVEVKITNASGTSICNMRSLPIWLSILPPIISILMALITKEVYSSLFVGLLFGAGAIHWSQGSNIAMSGIQGVLSVADTYVVSALTDADHISIIAFSMLIGGMVALITANGGMKGVVDHISRYARSRKSGMIISWLMGIVIFFDDYANTLVVGNTMRPITDKLRISREKLAYIVDSTTAPIAAIAFITTWIGAELSYIQEGLQYTTINESPYIVFINSFKYSFYPILTLIFVAIIVISGRDFGPMLKCEKNAVKGLPLDNNKKKIIEGNESAQKSVVENGRWFNAIIPVAIVVIGTIIGLMYTGWSDEVWANNSNTFATKLSETIGSANSFKALLWASTIGVLVSVILTIAQRLLKLQELINTLISGFKSMFNALLVLTLAWGLSILTKQLHTADFVIGLLSHINVTPAVLPIITFCISALIAFSTGTSWGTMAIIYPLMLPAAWEIGQTAMLDQADMAALFHNTVATVLAGSVWGDHCSPISDTTILSSLSCSCNHISHVRTQMPYAITVGVVSLLFGSLPVGFGFPTWASFIICTVILCLIVMFFGKKDYSENKMQSI